MEYKLQNIFENNQIINKLINANIILEAELK